MVREEAAAAAGWLVQAAVAVGKPLLIHAEAEVRVAAAAFALRLLDVEPAAATRESGSCHNHS
jgi:hypothetical protein